MGSVPVESITVDAQPNGPSGGVTDPIAGAAANGAGQSRSARKLEARAIKLDPKE